MSPFPQVYRRPGAHFVYFYAVPVFMIGFQLLFKPEPLSDLISSTPLDPQSAFLLTCAITMGVILISRTLMMSFGRLIQSSGTYWIWTAIELVLIAIFTGLFFCLETGQEIIYYEAFCRCFVALVPVVFIIYFILDLFFIIWENEKNPGDVEDSPRVKFYDDRHSLKFVVERNSILFIEASENYVKIYYVENGVIKNYSLRTSMRSLEELCSANNLVRCHRSYYVNVSHVKILRRDKEGIIYIELDNPDARHLPVTKRYYDAVSSLL